MALTKTTLAAAVAVNDTSIKVTAATGFADGYNFTIDEEFFTVQKGYTASGATTIVPVIRGLNGTVQAAHVSGANVVLATGAVGSQFAQPPAATVVAYGLAARRRKKLSYSAAGALTLPTAGEDMVAIINGTSGLAMTLAVPTTDNDADVLTVVSNGKAAHTVTLATAAGDAGSGYTVFTFPSGGQISVSFMAANGIWVSMNTPISGTSTNITTAIS